MSSIGLEDILKSKIITRKPLHGGDIADVSRIKTLDGRDLVVKKAVGAEHSLMVEAKMLDYLSTNSRLPVPTVRYANRGYLIMDYIPHEGKRDMLKAAISTAEHIAELHRIHPMSPKPLFGFEDNTVIGPLEQVNGWSDNWCSFFAEKRLNHMKEAAAEAGNLPVAYCTRIDNLLRVLPDLLPARVKSSLLHGDLWSGNILVDGNKVVGFIDPAISYGHREMDLAFMDLMGGMGKPFFDAYNTLFPLRNGFWKVRRYIYQLWPLLVHVRLFGSGYLPSVDKALDTLNH